MMKSFDSIQTKEKLEKMYNNSLGKIRSKALFTRDILAHNIEILR